MISYKKRWKYKYTLADDYAFPTTGLTVPENIDLGFVVLNTDGLLTIRKGYAWDGPSDPAIDTKNFLRPSLIRDALYQLMREEKLPQTCRLRADEILREECRENGMCKPRAWWVFKAVRLWGEKSVRPDMLEAP